MRWSDCIASKSSFWSNEATLNVLKSMKKIGRYNQKIGIGIGSLEGRNFAHLCIFVISYWGLQVGTEAPFSSHINIGGHR
jgi:hypothetical protein